MRLACLVWNYDDSRRWTQLDWRIRPVRVDLMVVGPQTIRWLNTDGGSGCFEMREPVRETDGPSFI